MDSPINAGIVENENWALVQSSLNIWHFLLCLVLGFGCIFLPLKYLLILIFANLILLYRYHDYCFVSKVTDLAGEWAKGCRGGPGYSENLLDLFNDLFGISLTKEMLSGTSTALFMCSCVIALTRLALAYSIPFISDWVGFSIAVWCIGLWVTYEVYITFFYVPSVYCQA
ncbi:MAG: hypothetical protein K0U20_08225 [Proteobacteria bacterium]|nr:hypothetical protein [Pseudomonadota bacterium]